MNRASQMVAFLAVPVVAIGVLESVWGGIMIAALELGFCAVLRIRRRPQ